MQTLKFTIPIIPKAKMVQKHRSYVLKDNQAEILDEAMYRITYTSPNKYFDIITNVIKQTIKSIKSQSYKHPTQQANEEEICFHLNRFKPKKPFDCPILLSVIACLPVPKSWTKKQREKALNQEIIPKSRPDLSNYIKMIEDCLTTMGFWVDDARVYKYLSPEKQYSINPRWEITLIALEE